jgi:hypothetical protein
VESAPTGYEFSHIYYENEMFEYIFVPTFRLMWDLKTRPREEKGVDDVPTHSRSIEKEDTSGLSKIMVEVLESSTSIDIHEEWNWTMYLKE